MDRAVRRFVSRHLHRCLCPHARACNIQSFRHCRHIPWRKLQHDLRQYHHHRDHGWFFCSHIFHTSFGATYYLAACTYHQRAQLDYHGAGCAGNYRSRAAHHGAATFYNGHDTPYNPSGAARHGSKQA